jgi:hypothetical protein
MIYRDVVCLVDFRTMTFVDDEISYKLRRETAISSRRIRLG